MMEGDRAHVHEDKPEAKRMNADVRVAGVGMVPFSKPSAGAKYEDMASGAIRAALSDSGLALEDIQEAYASYVYGDSTCGQDAMYEVGLTGIPIIHVNNNCASGSTALWQARKAVAGGEVDVALAFGFEQMPPGAVVAHWDDRPAPGRARCAVAYRVQLAGAAQVRMMGAVEMTTDRRAYVLKAHLGGIVAGQVFCACLGARPREDFSPYVADFFLQLEDVKCSQDLAENPCDTRRGVDAASSQLQQGGLSGPVRSEDDPALAFLDLPGDVVEQRVATADHADAGEFEDVAHDP